jgi:hypothetical protein
MINIDWSKLSHDFADDAKFQRVADITGASVELAQACFARALCRASANPDRGSLAGVDFEEFAWWFKKPVELIRSIFECFEHVAHMIKDGRLANWAKRQGAAAVKLAEAVAREAAGAVSAGAVSAGAERTRRWRQKKARDPRQSEMLLPIEGGQEASPKPPSQASHPHPVTDPVTEGVTVTTEEEGESQRIQDSFLKNTKGESCGRDAPLEVAEPANQNRPRKPSQDPWVKAQKKEMRRQKVLRFITAHYTGAELTRYLDGMVGCDPEHDEQWWFDHVDDERRRIGWDDTRDIANDNRWRAAA